MSSPVFREQDLCTHELFEAQVRKTPSAVALVDGAQRLTYEALNRKSNQVAHRLRALGVGPEVSAGICLERSADAVVALMGVLKAGGAYVYLDPGYPADRLDIMIQAAQIDLTITTASLANHVRRRSGVLCIDREALALAAESTENCVSGIMLNNLASVTYTSGSTGVPKCVMHPHYSLIHYRPVFQLGDICCLNAPLSFSFSFSRMFPPLICGVPIVVAPDPVLKDAERFAALIGIERITTLSVVPSLLRQLLDLPKVSLSHLQTLRAVTVGGAALTADLAAAFRVALPRARLLYGLGSSETVAATLWEVTGAERPNLKCIGQPLPNTRVLVLGSNLEAPPTGDVGQLCIGGHQIARGYLNRPDLTAERFLPDPFGGFGERLFCTGDLVRILPGGEIELAGRSDHQVKIRGFRVDLEDLEAVIGSHPDIIESAVTAEETDGEQRLVAYVVGKTGAHLPMSALRAHLSGRLPDYMMPALFVPLEVFPLTPNGKLDRHALRPPDGFRAQKNPLYQEPRNRIESQLAEIWASLLDCAYVGVHDRFPDLGGNSLVAARIISRIRDAFGVELSIRFIFEHPTIAEVADEIQSAAPRGNISAPTE